jgi:hypothetical protein
MPTGYTGGLFAIGIISAALAMAIPRLHAAQPIEVKEAWLKRDCKDKGTLDHPTSNPEYEACLRKLIEPLPPLDKNRRELFGEQYDPSKYIACRTRPGNRTNSACDIYILRRREWPEYWPEGAKKIEWPDSPKEGVYRKGMKPKEYWEALCKQEAGEFVYGGAEGVEALYSARPRGQASDQELADRFVLEDPFTYSDVQASAAPQDYFVQPFLGTYRVLEMRNSVSSSGFVQFFRSEKPTGPPFQTMKDGRWVRVPYIVSRLPTHTISAKYAYSWRGITRPHDRELGIAGGELAITNIATGELLGFRRGFALSGQVPNSASGFWWLSAQRCPAKNGISSNMAFIQRVLRPIPRINESIKAAE